MQLLTQLHGLLHELIFVQLTVNLVGFLTSLAFVNSAETDPYFKIPLKTPYKSIIYSIYLP